MYSWNLTETMDTNEPANLSDASSAMKAIGNEGLVVDHKVLPCFCLFDLFDELTKDHNVTRAQIKTKISSLYDYLTLNGSTSNKTPFSVLLSHTTGNKPNFGDNDGIFFDTILLSLFAYSFKLRIEMRTEISGIVTTQYYGLKDSYVKRVLMTSDNYILLKKKNKTALRRNNKVNDKIIATVAYDKAKQSTTTLATDCNSIYVKSVNSTDNRDSSPMNLFSTLTSAHTAADLKSQVVNQQHTSLNNSVCSVEELALPSTNAISFSNDSTKTVGRLKFFNDAKEYGFIVLEDQTEIFVHKADLAKDNIDTRFLVYYKQFYDIVLEFNIQEYRGRVKVNRKAVDLAIRDMIAVC